MSWIIDKLHLDRASQESGFQQIWNVTQVNIIVFESTDVGWLQSFIQDDDLFVGQLILDGPFQGRGVGTEVMKNLIRRAAKSNRAVRLNVVKINPAVRLYERLGFQIVREDERKFYMKLDADKATQISD